MFVAKFSMSVLLYFGNFSVPKFHTQIKTTEKFMNIPGLLARVSF